ncbi:unnamed protein product [Urochloa humidicola]
MAPEHAVLGHLSVKLDIYSFGVLILEIVNGRRNTDMFESAGEESIILLSYVWDHWLNALCRCAPWTRLWTARSRRERCSSASTSHSSRAGEPADRPTMLDVLVMLHDQLAAPSNPAFAYGELSSVKS